MKRENWQGASAARKADEARLYALRGGLTTQTAYPDDFTLNEVFRDALMKTLDNACLSLASDAGRISSIALVARMSKFDFDKYGVRFYDVFRTIQDLSDQLSENLNSVSNMLAMINGMDESALLCRKLPDDTSAELIEYAIELVAKYGICANNNGTA